MAKVWVFAEVGPDGPAPAALELLAKARELGDVEAVALGPGATAAAARSVTTAPGPSSRATTRSTTSSWRNLRRTRCTRWRGSTGPTSSCSRRRTRRATSRADCRRKTGHRAHEQRDRRRERRQGSDPDRGRDALRRCRTRRARSPSRPRAAEVVRRGARRGDRRGRAGRRRDPPELKTARRVERHEESASGPKLEEARVVISGGRGLQEAANFACWISSPRRSATPPSAPVAPSSTRAGSRTATRSDRPARR